MNLIFTVHRYSDIGENLGVTAVQPADDVQPSSAHYTVLRHGCSSERTQGTGRAGCGASESGLGMQQWSGVAGIVAGRRQNR